MRWKIIGGLQTVFGTRKMLVTKSLCYDEENGKQEGMEFFVQLHGPTSNLELDIFFFFFQAEDGIRDLTVTGDQTCALPILETPLQPGAPARLARLPGTGTGGVCTNARHMGPCTTPASFSNHPGHGPKTGHALTFQIGRASCRERV